MKKRIISLLLVIVMVVSFLPASVFAADGEEATVTYDALVAQNITVDGSLTENAWLAGGKLSGGQTFDILWDGAGLYFAVVAGEADTALTVKVGQTTILSAEKASGAAAIEAQVAYNVKGVTTIEDVTLAVGESTWTGDVNLVKYTRTEKVTPPSLGPAATKPVAYENGYEFSLPADADNTTTDYRSYAMALNNSTLAQRGNGIRFEFDFDPTGMTAHTGAEQKASGWTANAGFNAVMMGPNKERIVYGIDNIEGTGLVFIIQTSTWGQRATYNLGRTAADGVFHLSLEWTAAGLVKLYVDGNYLTSFEGKQFVHPKETTANAMLVEARRYRAFNSTSVGFKVYNMVLSLPAEVSFVNEGTYDAFVASDLALDGAMDEIAWRTNAKLGGGQAFDILFDGNNLYFGVEAGASDTALTVEIGDETVATATKASGASAIEAKVEYLTQDVDVIEDVTLTLGDSVWTGDVNLVKLGRQEDMPYADVKTAQQGNPGTVTAAADGESLVFELPAIEAANQTTSTITAYKTPTATIGQRTGDVAFEFTLDPEAFPSVVGHSGTVGKTNSVFAGIDVSLADANGEAIRFGIAYNGEYGMFLRFTRVAKDLGVIYLGKTMGDDPFAIKVLWKADDSAEVFVDGISLGTVADVVNSDADMTEATLATNNMIHIRGFRYDYKFELYDEDLKFTLSDIRVATPAEVTYVTDETISDGQLESLFVDSEPTLSSPSWANANWENFADSTGKVAALVYDTHVYLAVESTGTGTVSATLGEETVTAELVDGVALLRFSTTAVSEYGQKLALSVSVGGNAVWAQTGELTVAQEVIDKPVVLDITKGLINSNFAKFVAATNSVNLFSSAAKPAYDSSNCAYWIYNKADFASYYDSAKDTLLEQTIRIDEMPALAAAGTYNSVGSAHLGDGYITMFELPSTSASGQSDLFSSLVYPNANGELYLTTMNSAGTHNTGISLGKKLGDEFKLGLLCRPDGSVVAYVDGQEIGSFADARYVRTKIYTSAIMLKYMDSGNNPLSNTDIQPASMFVSNFSVTSAGNKIELVDVEEEITKEAIFGSLDLQKVSDDLPLNDTFKTAYLGEKALTWTSTNKAAVATDGTVTVSAFNDQTATLSVYLEDSETALWSVDVFIPASTPSLKALLSESAITADGKLDEPVWFNWKKFSGDPAGNIAAAWTKGYVYFAAHSAQADTLSLTLNGKAITVDLKSGTITGAPNAQIGRNAATGEVEIAIPLSDIDVNLTDYNQFTSFEAKLLASEAASDLDANILVFTGDVAEIQTLANYTKSSGPWTLLTDNISFNGPERGAVDYVFKTDNSYLDHNDLIIFSNEFLFEALPITDGAFEKTAAQANGFYYYFSDEDAVSRVGATIAASIYTEDGTNLKLRISQGKGLEGQVFDLGKTLGEKFRLTYFWNEDNSLEIFVDGVLIGTAKNAGITTSYLGVDVVTYRYYSEKASTEKVKFTVSNQTLIVTKYETVLDELTQNAVFGRVDLDHVQKDLPMVTTFASANFDALNLKWISSDESVVAADGTITRHATEAKSAEITVYFIDAEGNEIKLWSVTVTVDPMSVTKQPAPAIIHTGFAIPGSIAVDGVVETDETWLLNGWVLNAQQQPVGYFGAQWDQENLYVLLNTEAEAVSLNINGKAFDVQMVDSVAEVKIPMADLGLEKLEQTGKTLPITVTIGGDAYEGILNLTNVDWWGTDNIYAGLPMLANNVKSVKMGTADVPDGNQGAKQLENGWRVYDLYGGEEASNPAGIRTYILFMKMPVYESFADRTEATHVEFDFHVKAMPERAWDEAIKNEVGRAFANYGVTFSLSDKADSTKNSNVAVFGITNTADEGLVLVVNRGSEDYEHFVLNKQVGEEFRIGLTWLTNANLVLTIDGEELTTINNMSKFVNAVGDTSFVVNMLRNKEKPASSADDMDVYITNIGFGKAYSTENIIRNLTFADFCGKNEAEDNILYDLELPASMTNGQLDQQYPITWTSSDEAAVDPETGKVTRPANGVKVVTLTATLDNNGVTETKEFSLIVMGEVVDNGNVLVVADDVNPFGKAASEYTGLLYNLDQNNNSVVYAFPEGEVEKINLVTLTDLDETSRLTRESLRLFVSDDNVTYTEIDGYKLHHDGCNWYLYGFETESRYIKAHYTHRDRDLTDFVNTPGEMIHVSWNESLVIPETAAETDVPATSLLDEAAKITLPEGITAEGLRVTLNGEFLFHYVDANGDVYVRIPDPTSGKLQLWNAEDIELANKENVYEVTYGTRETLPSGGRWVMGLKAGTTFPDGSSLTVDTLFSMGSKSVNASVDGGYTWKSVGSINFSADKLSSGGWGFDSKTGRMFHEFYGTAAFNGSDITATECITYVFYSDDGGKTWTQSTGLGQIEGDLQSNYVLSYTDLTELSCNDGEGPNVDFVFPMGAQFNNNGAFCGRVAYTKDGGKSWSYSESKITYGNETAFEGGVSEATILEREDGTLVYYARCQSSGVDNFTISYSLDHGVTWLTPGMTSTVYTTNTQALMMTYDFDGFDGNRLTGVPMFMWGGNNVMGGSSYVRMPLNFAISTNGMDTFRQIQDIFAETFMNDFTYAASHYITNPSIQQINGGDMYLAFSRLRAGDSIYMVVDDFTNWFLRTKGAYDSFEGSTVLSEGWIVSKGVAEVTNAKAAEGKSSLLIKENALITRSVPYLQDGKLSIDLYADASSKFVLELQPAFSAIELKCAVISADVTGTTMTLHDGTVLNLTEGWNTVTIDLALTDYEASIGINGGEMQAIAVNTEFNGTKFNGMEAHEVGNYITYLTILASSDVYVDELLIESYLDAVLEATEADEAAAEAVIEKIEAIDQEEITMDDREAIEAARAAYDALTQTQRDLVNRNVPTGTSTNVNDEGALINYYNELLAAEEALQALIDAEIANEVEELIDAIGEVTLESEEAIEAAREAYDALTEDQQALVENYDELVAAEQALAELKASEADKAAAAAVEELIDAIGEVTLESEEAIEAAREAYDALTDLQKELVDNYDELVAAEEALAELKAEAESKAAVEAVEELIDAIGEVTLESEEAIEAARAAYEALTDEQKEQVSNLADLIAAEQALAELQAEAEKAAADKAAAEAVEEMIESIGGVTLGDEAAIKAARKAYNALTDEQKALVSNYADLLAAEKALAALKEQGGSPDTGDESTLVLWAVMALAAACGLVVLTADRKRFIRK